MSKDVRICKCGVIHFLDSDLIDEAIDNNRNLLMICGSCGHGSVIGGDETIDYEGQTAYMMYTGDLIHHGCDNSVEITADDFVDRAERKAYSRIIVDPGKKVMMKTAYRATSYWNGTFYDGTFPDTNPIEDVRLDAGDIREYIERKKRESMEVDMNMLMRDLSDEELEALSHLAISAFDWTGTKYEYK